MSSHRPHNSSKRGFTLIEILVTITIIGIAAAVVVPSMLTAGTLGVQGAARIIVADLMYAQNEAMARNAPYRVTFAPDDESYQLTDDDGVLLKSALSGGGDNNYVVDFTGDSRFEGVEIVSASFSGSPTVRFNELGAPDAGGTIELRYNYNRYRITVAEFTGRIAVEKVTGGG